MKPPTSTPTAVKMAEGTSWNSPIFTPSLNSPVRCTTLAGSVPSGSTSAMTM